jgi:general secretion pathway protein D
MKTTLLPLTALALASLLIVAHSQDAAPATAPASPRDAAKNDRAEKRKADRKAERRAAKRSPAPPAAEAAAPAAPAEPEPELRLNFRGVPLEMVLNYLSEAAGFTIMLETQVKGTVDVWSNQPLKKAEAVELLNTVLSKNGYAAIQNGRLLTIVARDEAKKRNIPVKTGADPLAIPKSEEIVTQIVPVRYISAAQLVRDLQPLLPATAVITANEGGNSLVITDSQANIRRVAEIVSALDTAQSGVSGIRVFALKYADAKALATTIRDLFQDAGRGGSSNDPRSAIAAFISSRTGGPGGGPPGFSSRGGDSGRSSSGSSSRGPAASTRVIAVADEHSNSLIVSASEDLMPTIEQVIATVDTDVQDLTEIRVFTLKYADPTEMATLLSGLFADNTSSDQSRGGGFRFGGGFPGFPGGGPPGGDRGSSRSSSGSDSERKKMQSRVVAVADPRTASVVVMAAKELMPQIAEMVLQLDSNPARKQKVFVYSLDNANVQEVESVLRNLFESQNTRGTGSTLNQQNNALINRQNTTSQQQQGITGGFGGFGAGGGGLGGGGNR